MILVNDWQEACVKAGHNEAIESLDISVDGRVASADTDGKLILWKLSDSGKLSVVREREFDDGVGDVAFDGTGKRLAVSDRYREVFLLDSETLADLWPRPVVAPARPGKLSWSADNRHIACGNFGILNAFDGRLEDPSACNRGGRVAWHPSGLIVTGSRQGEIEYRAAPDYQLRSRSLQLAGGVTVTVPATGNVAEALKKPLPHLCWVHQPSPGRYLVTSKRGRR